jgi:hypothetical protein
MKTLHIDFVESKHWQLLWALAVVAVMAIGLVYGRQYQKLSEERKSIELLATELRQKLVPEPSNPTAANPRTGHGLQVASHLQNDLNLVFTLIEAVKEPNARLRTLSVDASSNILRLEYEIDSMARASQVTTWLNAGHEDGPWRLESINSSASGSGNTPAGIVPNPAQFRAFWTTNSLRP